ncbi:MAG: YihY/virulence factor BrkB family protein [Acutalibacteraceae bacterium]
MSLKERISRWVNYYMGFSKEIEDHHIFAYASQASFFVVISAFPFLMILLNILQAVMPVPKEYFQSFIAEFLPYQIQELANKLVDDFYGKVNISLVSVTTIFLIWSSSRGVKAITYGLRIVFNTKEDQGIIKLTLWSLVYTVLFMVSIIVSIAVLLFGSHLFDMLGNYIPPIKTLLSLIFNLRYVVLHVFLTLVFMGAYKFLGKTKIKFRKQFIGAALSAAFWLIFSYFYSLYIENFSKMSYIYGSLTAVIFLMLWLWFCMISLLIGAQVNSWLYQKNMSLLDFVKGGFVQMKQNNKK